MTRRASLSLRVATGVLAVVVGVCTSAGAALADVRSYEKVTPVDKNDFDSSITSDIFRSWPAVTGDKLLWWGGGGAYAGVTSNVGTNYVASRTDRGWETVPVSPDANPEARTYGTGVVAPDLSRLSVLGIRGTDQIGPPTVPVLLGVGPAHGPFTTIATLPPDEFEAPARAGSDDLRHLVFQVRNGTSLSPAPTETIVGNTLYEWVDGDLRIVDRATDGSSMPCGAVIPRSLNNDPNVSFRMMSRDGRRVFFVSPDPAVVGADPACSEPPQLYLRENGTTTVKVSAPEPGVSDPSGPQSAQFAGASADGSKVFFVTTGQLTPDVSTHDPELYGYDIDTDTLTRISRGPSGSADGGVGSVNVSDDGSAVYFTATHQLIPGQGVDESYPGATSNLYRYDVVNGTYTYIATLMTGDLADVNHGFVDFVAPFVETNWSATPDGRYLLFASAASLTASSPGNGTIQLYRYDAGAGSLTCVSCPAPGASASRAQVVHFSVLPDFVNRPNRAMTDDGKRVFFDTATPLGAKDTNSSTDVYEWHDGTVSLISSGGDEPAYFLGSGGNGRDVFFTTRNPLVPADRDHIADIYDARIDGGFPAANPTAGPCASVECQGLPSPPPPTPVVASVSFVGSGNVRSTRVSQLRLSGKSVRGYTIALRVRTPGSGRLRADGRGLTPATQAVARAGDYRLTLRLTARARRELRRRHRMAFSIRVRYVGPNGRVSSVRVPVTAKA
jgi:Tol biopolymer transport system component